jgi:DNA invertase Pin-like site-specific DNA recombinase
MRSVGEQLSVDGYVRVSSVRRREGERFISPAVQRDLIHGWAAMRGARVLRIFEELDESGRRADRPLLEGALRRVESGVSQGIVVSKVDRFGRSLLSGLAAIERVRAAGGTFVAVEDGLDMSTDTGRLVVRILLSLGEWESDRIATSWEHARARAVARGVYSAPGAPVGYRRTPSGRLRPDPKTAEVIAEVFRRRADGETGASLARWLEAQGVRTSRGNPGWPPSAIRTVLAARIYLGEVRYGSHINERAHPPLVDAATWEAAQHPRRAIVFHKPDRMLLARLVRCAGCSMVMTAFARWDGNRLKEVFYRCNRHSAAGRCPAPAAITALYLDAYVEEHMFALLRRRRNAPAIALAGAEQALDAATVARARYRDSDRVLETLGPDAFAAGMAVRARRVRAARLHLAAARDADSVYALPPAGELERRWDEMTDHERRAVIAQVIDCVFVSRGQLHAEDRVTICRAGTAPQLPSTSAHHGGGARPFTAHASHELPPLVPWSAKRIQRELAEYLRGQRTWPSATSFVSAGRRRLYDQVLRHAGVSCWAHHFGLPTIGEPRSREPWTERRIRAALELYLRRKRRFPTAVQFSVEGLGSLHRGVIRTGGTRRWSTELGMPVAPNQRRHRASYSTHR